MPGLGWVEALRGTGGKEAISGIRSFTKELLGGYASPVGYGALAGATWGLFSNDTGIIGGAIKGATIGAVGKFGFNSFSKPGGLSGLTGGSSASRSFTRKPYNSRASRYSSRTRKRFTSMDANTWGSSNFGMGRFASRRAETGRRAR